MDTHIKEVKILSNSQLLLTTSYGLYFGTITKSKDRFVIVFTNEVYFFGKPVGMLKSH